MTKTDTLVKRHALRIGRLDIDLAGEPLVAVLRCNARRLVVEGAADTPALGGFAYGDAVNVEVVVELRFEPAVIVARIGGARTYQDEKAAALAVDFGDEHAMRPACNVGVVLGVHLSHGRRRRGVEGEDEVLVALHRVAD